MNFVNEVNGIKLRSCGGELERPQSGDDMEADKRKKTWRKNSIIAVCHYNIVC